MGTLTDFAWFWVCYNHFWVPLRGTLPAIQLRSWFLFLRFLDWLVFSSKKLKLREIQAREPRDCFYTSAFSHLFFTPSFSFLFSFWNAFSWVFLFFHVFTVLEAAHLIAVLLLQFVYWQKKVSPGVVFSLQSLPWFVFLFCHFFLISSLIRLLPHIYSCVDEELREKNK